jgi:tetratricopeptide (TPR) repeat protein
VTPASPPSVATPASPATVQELRDEAFAAVRQLMADFPGSPVPVSCMGALHHAFRNPDEAEKWWRKALELDPKRAATYVALAKAALSRGDLQKAEELWRHAWEIGPNAPGVSLGYATLLLTMNKPDEAIAALEKSGRASPRNSRHFALLGKAYLQRKDYQKAVENYLRVGEVGAGDPAVCNGLATAYARLGKQDKADEWLERLRVLRERHAEQERLQSGEEYLDRDWSASVLVLTLSDAGQMYAEHKNLPKAEACWRRAAAVDPKNKGCRYSLAELYGATGRLREAMSVCEQLGAIGPPTTADAVNLGMLLARLQQFDAAEAAFGKAIELDPKSPAGHRSLVRLLLSRNRNLPEARTWAEKLVALEPSAPNCLLLGQACSRAGDLPAARAALERALQLEPDNENVKKAYRVLQEGK